MNIPGSTNKPGYLYHQPAFAEPDFKVHRSNNRERLNFLLASENWQHKNVLDLGCSAGYFSLHLAMAGARVTGIDPDTLSLAICKNQARDYGIENTYFATPDPQRRWRKDKDVLLAFSVLPWIYQTEPDPENYIAQLFEINTAYIEVQYPPDGRASVPGVTDDESAKMWLGEFYPNVVRLGVATDETEGIKRQRTIWKCWRDDETPGCCYGSQAEVTFFENTVVKASREGKNYDALKEAAMLKRVADFNIAPKVVELQPDDEIDGAYFLSMTRIYGRPLLHSGITLEELKAGLHRIMEALAAAGIAHHDIRPDNLIYGNDRQLYLIDFGHATEINQPAPEGVNPHYGSDDPAALQNVLNTYEKIIKNLC